MPASTLGRRTETSSASNPSDTARRYHGGRQTLIILVTTAFICGLALSWNWLLVVGAASLLLAALL